MQTCDSVLGDPAAEGPRCVGDKLESHSSDSGNPLWRLIAAEPPEFAGSVF